MNAEEKIDEDYYEHPDVFGKEDGDIERLRRRFPNSMPYSLLKCGHYCGSGEKIDYGWYLKAPPHLMKPERPGERMAY